MALYAIRSPRGVVVDAVNECINPQLDVNLSGYIDDHYFGADGAGTWGRIQSAYTLKPGGWMLERKWTTASRAFTPVVGAGHKYQTAWSGGETRSIGWNAAVVGHSCNVIMRVEFTDAVGNILAQYDTPTRFINGGWVRFTNTVTAPGGTWYANIRVMMVDGVAPVGAAIWAAQLIITRTATVYDYFDGYSAASGVYTYGWASTAGASPSYRYVPDPATDVRPDAVMGYDRNRPARNVVHQYLSGTVGAALYSGGLRTGTLKLYFLDPAKAETAERALAGAGTWAFADDDNAGEGMTFIVVGSGVRSYQSDNRLRRVLEVPYQEITA